MTSERQHPLDWVAPLLVGASAAIAAEVAMGMLIYAGDGFMRSLTTVLAVEVVALGVGLWGAPAPRPDVVDRLRRRWMLCLFSFMTAAVFGVAWSLVPEVGGGPTGQALGLTLLAALPLFMCGTVLGGMGSVMRAAPPGVMREPGAAAALGAGLGFVLTGFLLPRAPLPASLIVACLILLSAGGLVYGVVLSALEDAEDPGAPGAAGAVTTDVATPASETLQTDPRSDDADPHTGGFRPLSEESRAT